MHWKLFADLAEYAGTREVDVDVAAAEPTVGDALEALLAAHPALAERVYDADGELHAHLNLLRNGEDIAHEAGLATPVEAGDELALFPPVTGG